MNILGINAYHANASAALVCEGKLVAAVEEERFNRVKYAAGFPAAAVRYCLNTAGLTLADIDHIAVPRNPWARIFRKSAYAVRMPRFAAERTRAWASFADIPAALGDAFQTDPKRLRARIHHVEHHRAHLGSAFLLSPFERAAILSADGMGDFASTMWAAGEGHRMRIHGSIAFPHSLGLYYTALTQYLGFWNFGDEYKVMGLAAYGEPVFIEEFRRIVRNNSESLKLALEYFTHHRRGAEMSWSDAGKTPVIGRLFSEYLEARLGPARQPGAPLEATHIHIAASLQARLEEILLQKLTVLHEQTGCGALCLAGGVALNCVANGKMARQSPFKQIFVQPAAGDAGLALGAAFYVWHEVLGRTRSFQMNHGSWGPSYSNSAITAAIQENRLLEQDLDFTELPEEQLLAITARHIADGNIVGWFSGGAEWGPRALGNRSILADPRRPEIKDVLNRRIKHRESFRPFAPSILVESAAEFFETAHPSPFMTFTFPLLPAKRTSLPAATHVDGTCRLHTVHREANPRYWKLITEFAKLTGVPAVVNTSFNDNEPMVCAPEEAIDCFLRTHMDVLVIGNYLICKRHSTREISAGLAGSRFSEVSR